MKLWIRSQDRMSLGECNSIFVNEFIASNGRHKGCCILANGCRVGNYPTKGRCLEILDEIQELLKIGDAQNAFYHFHGGIMEHDDFVEMIKLIRETRAIATTEGESLELTMPSTVVYEMPKE